MAKQTANISSLAINASQNVNFSFSAPINTSDTVITLAVTADSTNAIAELDEANNTRDANIAIKAARPDLTITSLTTDKVSYNAGDPVTETANMKNAGCVDVSSCEVSVTPGSLTAVTKTTGAISASGSALVVFTFTIPAVTTSGSIIITAMADPNNKIVEADETNNSKAYMIGINASVTDLIIKALTTDKQTYEAGETVTVSATVANLGDIAVSAPLPGVSCCSWA